MKIEIKKTPIGDENENVSEVFNIVPNIEIKKTPIGDENKVQRVISNTFMIIEIKKTPIGDENAKLNGSFVWYVCELKLKRPR